jgi:hypothetical protein
MSSSGSAEAHYRASGVQPTACMEAAEVAASSISLAVSVGWDTYATWLEFTSTVLALARFAIMRSWSGLIDRSWAATIYQVGLVFQAGDVTWWVNESVEIGTCDTAMNHAFSGGMSAAKSAANWSYSIHQFPLLSGLNALEACGRACSIVAQLSPVSSANAAI